MTALRTRARASNGWSGPVYADDRIPGPSYPLVS